jgi:hypothetical protein
MQAPVFTDFRDAVATGRFAPVSESMVLGVSDVVSSTAAIRAGRYKAVNLAGAAPISAMINALGRQDFPFVFGGDGAAMLVEARERVLLERALSETATFVREALGLTLRVGAVTVAELRARGADVTLAWFAPSEQARYALLAGGGLALAEAELKAGRLALPPAPPGSRPNLDGLSCRFSPTRGRHGLVMSLIVRERPGAPAGAFATVVDAMLDIIRREERDGHPLPALGPSFSFLPDTLGFERKAAHGGWRRHWLALRAFTISAGILFRTGWRAGRFDPALYRADLVANSDFRKFDDGLRMTVDCMPETAAAIETLLSEAEAKGVLRFGLARQEQSLVTCIVPSPLERGHLHFIDGAGGGYALAARALKGKEGEPSAAPSPPA